MISSPKRHQIHATTHPLLQDHDSARGLLTAALIGALCWSLLGVLGCVMAFLWTATTHRAGWANHNLLLFSPGIL